MADATSSSITIAAPPERVMAVIADFAAYPEWAEQINTVEVLAPGADGPRRAGALHDGRRARSRTRTRWTTRGRPTAGRSAGPWSRGRSRRRRTARTRLAGRADSTTVTYSLAVDLNIPMIGMLRRKAEKVIIDTALKGLKRRVEALQQVTSVRAGRAVHGEGRRRQDDARGGHGRPPRPFGTQGAGRLDRPRALPRRRARSRARRRARRAGERALRRPHRHPRPARRRVGDRCSSTCAPCSPGRASTSWWPTS